jgi:outer membrane protein W
MRKLGCVVACIVVFFSMAMAGLNLKWEAGANLGYGLGVGGQNSGFGGGSLANTEQDLAGNYTKYDEIYASGGNGLKINVEGNCFFNDNLGVMLVSGISFLGGFDEKQVAPFGGVLITSETTISTGYVPINIGLKLKTTMGKFTPYVYLAPGMYICFGSGTNKTTGQANTDIAISFNPGWGFTGGLGAMYALNDKWGLKAEITPTYAFANLTQMSATQGGNKTTFIYQNNTPTVPDPSGPASDRKIYDHSQPKVPFSSVALNIGATYDF